MRTTALLLALALPMAFALPAAAQVSGQTDGSLTASTSTPRQPTGAVVPNPAATPATSIEGNARIDAETPTGTVRSRDTTGMRQSPENLNAFGCKQIDPLCQGGR